MSQNRYQAHADRMQREAEEAHKLWVSQMTKEQYEQAVQYGVIDPPKDSHKVGGHSPEQRKDLPDSPVASMETDMAAEIDRFPEILADRFGISLAAAQAIATWHGEIVDHTRIQHQAEIIQNIVAGLLSARNPKLSAAGLAFATQLDALNGLNQTEYATRNNISKSAVSKCTKGWQRALGINPSVHQKSESACESYQQTAKKAHWRNQIFKITSFLKNHRKTA